MKKLGKEEFAKIARENGRKGGRPRTGQTPQVLIRFPAEFSERVSGHLPAGMAKNRWIMEIVNREMDRLEGR